jgi:signal transduction histidine kinase
MPDEGTGAQPPAADRVQSAVAIPVAHGTEAPTGTLMLAWRSVWPASAKDVALAQQFGEQSWLLLETARLFEEVAAMRRTTDQARVRAEASEQAKGMFLATMSHEIRTPLNAVLGYAELLEMEIDGPLNDAQRDRLARLRRTGRHLLTLVTGILDVAKAEAGEMSVRREVGDLREVLSGALAAVVPQATAAGLVLSDDCGERIPVRYLGDADRVRQILVNLLSNAVKFTPRGGWVSISCQRVPHAELADRPTASGPWLRVDVADTGVGIPVARQQLIFDPFVQGHAAHERAAAGTGLGLTISRRLARLMGGDITLVSAPGAGSRFSLWLPTD